jgi:putative heme-binding domain-containing protein
MLFNLKKLIFFLAIVAVLGAASFTITKNPFSKHAIEDNPKIKKLRLSEGFAAEHIYSPSANNQGSWVAMAFDDKGRLITSDQYGKLYRLKIPAIGSSSLTPEVEKLKIGTGIGADTMGMGYSQGLLYAFNSLYVMVNNSKNNKTFTRQSGLYRLQDMDGDDQFEKVTFMKPMDGDGEHGPHSIKLSPDGKSLVVISGNHTDVPPMNHYRLPNNWQEDQLFPLIKDPRGHANDRMAPGGWVAQLDPEGKHWELLNAGYRNAYDFDFNEVGDLFVYDADMEWDFGTPWYRPTRVSHSTSGAEFGWRTGNSKWSQTYPDNLPPVINIGQGSPTNLIHLKNAKVPAKYQRTLLAFDWSFGIMHAIHLKPSGSTYTSERTEFLSGLPLPLTDGVVGPDGSIYFLTGGRRLESDLYRVTYVGSESTTPLTVTPINEANTLRRSLEKFHSGGPNPEAVKTAWPHLKSTDRFIRYAARLALEHQPVSQWQDLALTEKDPVASTQSLISLIRMGKGEKQNEIINALLKINFKTLTESQKIDVLRAFELSFLRMGMPTEANKAKIIAFMNPNYPANTAELNKMLSKNLLYLDAPGAIQKTLALMKLKDEPGANDNMLKTATNSNDLIARSTQYGGDIANTLANLPPMQHTYYANVLTMAKKGWTNAERETYFKWFNNAFKFKGGNSYVGFIDRSRKLALKNVPEDKRSYFDKLSGAELLSSNGNNLVSSAYPKGPGRRWTLESGSPVLDKGLTDRDFEQGKAMFSATTCKGCHTMLGQGGAAGPDLTQIGTRFSPKDLLEAIVDPDKTISDQYAATQFSLKNGTSIVGRLVNEDKLAYYVSQNPYAPESLEKVLKKNVSSTKTSNVSMMFQGLINSLNEEEFKDLMAYLISAGNPKNPMFKTQVQK